VQANRVSAQLFVDPPRQHVLARVLLHVVKAARPVDCAGHPVAWRKQPFHPVPHLARPVRVYVRHGQAVQRAGVKGLSAGGGVKRRPVQAHRAVPDFQHPPLEFFKVGIRIIQAIGHDSSPSLSTSIPRPKARRKQISFNKGFTFFDIDFLLPLIYNDLANGR
jgi:hypothetical protein